MKLFRTTHTVFSLLLLISAVYGDCETEQETSLDECYSSKCPDCGLFSAETDTTDADLDNIQEFICNSLTESVCSSKKCCPDCNSEIDAIVSCSGLGSCVGDCSAAFAPLASTFVAVMVLAAGSFLLLV